MILELCQFLYHWKTVSCHNFSGLHSLICYNTLKQIFLYSQNCLNDYVWIYIFCVKIFCHFSTFQWPLRIHKNYSHRFFSFLYCMLILLYHSFTSPYSVSHPFLLYILNCFLLVTNSIWSVLDCSPSKLVQEASGYLVYGIFKGVWSSSDYTAMSVGGEAEE